MSKATIRDILYLFKNYYFIIAYRDWEAATPLQTWDICWKYCRDKGILDTIPKSCEIIGGAININLPR